MMSKLGKLITLITITVFLYGCGNNNSYQGYIEGDYSYIASAVAGNLLQLFVVRGDKVTTNQTLFVLDPQPESDKLQEAKYDLDVAQQNLINLQKGQRDTIIKALEAQREQAIASLDYNKKTYARYQILYKDRAIDKASLDQSRSTYEQNLQKITELEANIAEAKQGARENLIFAQEAAVKSAMAAVKQAEWAMAQKSVHAPTNGMIIDYLYELGEYVTSGSPVIILLSPAKIKVIFYVPEKIVSKIKVGDLIKIDCDGCKRAYTAKINFVSPKAEYTPPVIFSKDSRDKLVYRIEAHPPIEQAVLLHPGQPVDVMLIKN